MPNHLILGFAGNLEKTATMEFLNFINFVPHPVFCIADLIGGVKVDEQSGYMKTYMKGNYGISGNRLAAFRKLHHSRKRDFNRPALRRRWLPRVIARLLAISQWLWHLPSFLLLAYPFTAP
jgi:hypothetical protein